MSEFTIRISPGSESAKVESVKRMLEAHPYVTEVEIA